ncbi:hypothetical protein E4U55_003222 [Claviceps digitariae]|nr:hypothetical protein E4U55_003222 [Claviceps digitariae]
MASPSFQRQRHVPWEQMKMLETSSSSLSTPYLLSMTCGMGGLQVIWSVVLANGTAHIISLGVPKTWTPFIWLTAPLCGIFVQPLVGILSDRLDTPFGKRRPLIVFGTVGAVVSINLFAWAAEIVALLSEPRQLGCSATQPAVAIVVAVVGLVALQISLQPVQMGFRALVVDNVDPDQQIHANIWTSCWVGLGNIIGHVAGSLELDAFQRISRFQILTAIACACLMFSAGICCAVVKETAVRDSEPETLGIRDRSILGSLREAFVYTDRRIKSVCRIQFLSWMAWFPLLFYGSTLVTERYAETTTISTIHSPHSGLDSTQKVSMTTHIATAMGARLGSATYLVFSIAALLTSLLLPWLIGSRLVHTRGLTAHCSLSWALCQALFAICMGSQILVTSWIGSATLIACTGLPWAMTQGLPFAVIGEVLATDRMRGERKVPMGTILGLHNVAISLPQIVSAMIGSGVLYISEVVEDVNGTSWIMGMSALPAMAAAYFTAMDGFD